MSRCVQDIDWCRRCRQECKAVLNVSLSVALITYNYFALCTYVVNTLL